MQNKQFNHPQGLVILGIIWLTGIICDRIWFSLDNSIPAWDQADYLNGVMNYYYGLQHPQWFDSDWWRSLWLLSNKIPPFHYIITTPLLNLFGTSADAASLVMIFYSALLLIAVYGLGAILFDIRVALWAAILCQILPGLYYYRLEFLLDYPLTSIVTFTFYILTLWKIKQGGSWWLSIALGLSFGCSLLLKQTALFFLFIPIVWVLFGCFKNKQWLRITQLITAFFVSTVIWYPWYRTNWLLILTSGKRATLDSAIAEGDPAFNTIDAWIYYIKTLPYLLSWHILIIPLVAVLIYIINKFILRTVSFQNFNISNLKWLTIYLAGGYFLSSLNINKDARYILPLLPVLSLLLILCLFLSRRRWQKLVLSATVILAILLMLLNIFPWGGDLITQKLSPRVKHYPKIEKSYPHQEVVAAIINTSPYLRSTLGVLPSTPEINQHNFSFYGAQKKFQVVGRQVGVRENEVIQDAQSLDWFITKTGDQGSIPEAQKSITKVIETSKDFRLQKQWDLPDNSSLNLYHRRQPLVIVKPVENYSEVSQQFLDKVNTSQKIKLNQITIADKISPGVPVSITYQWLGSWPELQQGIVLLTWQRVNTIDNKLFGENQDLKKIVDDSYFLHDHAIAMGTLETSNNQNKATFQVIENTAMFPPNNLLPGRYKLTATYLNRYTQKTYPISLPDTTITVTLNEKETTTRQLDLVTQLRTVAINMKQGIPALEPIFAQTARINQYDGKQDYLQQTELSLSYRLKHHKVSLEQQINWTYAVGLSQVLQQDVKGAIATFKNLTEIDSNNPYNYAYLAFVYLYNWQPKLAEKSLEQAKQINPNISEIKTLSGIAALMQGNLLKAWKIGFR